MACKRHLPYESTSFIHPYKKLPENLLESLGQFEKQVSNFIEEVPDSLNYKFRPVRNILYFCSYFLFLGFWDDIIQSITKDLSLSAPEFFGTMAHFLFERPAVREVLRYPCLYSYPEIICLHFLTEVVTLFGLSNYKVRRIS